MSSATASGNRKFILGVLAVLVPLFGLTWGVGHSLLGDRMRVEQQLIEQSKDIEAVAADVGEVKRTLRILAENQRDIRVLEQRQDDLERRVRILEDGR
jgi:cell division protein FtsB